MISVIIPVYNAERWLLRCIDSVLSQSYKNIEVLLIDDGSTDMSPAICDSYASKDPRVKVFHKPNGGVASARQVGIDNLQGDYVIHADADDWMNKDMLQTLMEEAQKNNADVTMCDFTKVIGGGATYMSQAPTSLNSHDIIEDLIYGRLLGVLWNKLIKKTAISA